MAVAYVYLISTQDNKKTYCGYTTDPSKRIRQHNGLIAGGAKATKGKGPWDYLAVITSPSWKNKSSAMSMEWYVKHPQTRAPIRDARGLHGRLLTLEMALWPDVEYSLYINPSYTGPLPAFSPDTKIVREPIWS